MRTAWQNIVGDPAKKVSRGNPVILPAETTGHIPKCAYELNNGEEIKPTDERSIFGKFSTDYTPRTPNIMH